MLYVLFCYFHFTLGKQSYIQKRKIKRHYYITLNSMKKSELRTPWSSVDYTVLIISICPKLNLLTLAESDLKKIFMSLTLANKSSVFPFVVLHLLFLFSIYTLLSLIALAFQIFLFFQVLLFFWPRLS